MDLDIHDRIALADGVDYHAASGTIIDAALGSAHQLNPAARAVASHLSSSPGGVPLRSLVEALAGDPTVPEERVRDDLSQLLAALDSQALVRVRRPWRSRWLPSLWAGDLARLVSAGSNSRPARRFPATTLGIGNALVSMLSVILLAWFVLMTTLHLAITHVLPQAPASTTAYITLVSNLALVLFLVMWAHECGHLFALRRRGERAFIACRGVRIAVVHRPLDTPGGLIEVAVAGPALAMAVSCVLWPLHLLPWPPADAFLVSPVVGACHLLSLLPAAADGRMLRRALRPADTSAMGVQA